ncbi:carbohydrate ABC transporter permease [Alicyclobacillus fodiniaquatilis]|uniref:Carbohydrate ABC transporter permease n=1 Tax=Alicyclobacillus fodiniaquatilis TaxID=1661150 RepID=A0ABW4JAM6_9BACL
MSLTMTDKNKASQFKSGRNPRVRRNRIIGWLFIAPWAIGFLVFALYPFLSSLYYSFTSFDMLSPPKWIAFGNYGRLLHDPLFWRSLYNTLYYTIISVPVSTVLAIAVALLLNMKVHGQSIYRTIFYLPSVVPIVASSVLWLWLFNPSFGLINSFLRAVGLPAPGWLFSQLWVKPSLIIMGLWGLGAPIVIYLAALQGVPQELYEAAELEGCGRWRRIWHITVPMISPVILFNVIMGLINSFQYFTQAYVMTQGGPDNASLFYAVYLYRQAFQYLNFGYASAMAWLLFIVILAATVLVFRSSAKWVYYGGDR